LIEYGAAPSPSRWSTWRRTAKGGTR